MIYFKATGLLEADKLISNDFSKILQELIFNLKSKSKKKLFTATEYNYRSTYGLIYKHQYHDVTSTITTYLLVYPFNKYREKVLFIFEIYH